MQRAEDLGRAFLAELIQALVQRLGFERVAQHHALEQLGREVRNTGKGQLFTFGKTIADSDGAVVVDADDIARPGGLGVFAPVGHERDGIAHTDILARAQMAHLHAFLVMARADAHKGDPVAMLRVHIGLDLKHEARQRLFCGRHLARGGLASLRGRRPLDERVQQRADAEVVDRRSKKHRCDLAGPITL